MLAIGGVGWGCWDRQAWECPTVEFRACGRVRLKSPLSDLSVRELCHNTNILLTGMHKQEGLYAEMQHGHVNLWVCFQNIQSFFFFIITEIRIWLFFKCIFFQPTSVALPCSRCPPSNSTRNSVWGRVSRKQWPALASCVTGVRWRPNSCCPALSFPLSVPHSCFSLIQASCSREKLYLFLRHRRCLLIYEAQKI